MPEAYLTHRELALFFSIAGGIVAGWTVIQLLQPFFPLTENTIYNLKPDGFGVFLLEGVVLGCLICPYRNFGLRPVLFVLVAIWLQILIFGCLLSVQKLWLKEDLGLGLRGDRRFFVYVPPLCLFMAFGLITHIYLPTQA